MSKGFTALMYHSLCDGRYPDTHAPKYTTRLPTFRAHIAALIDSGFNLCSFQDLEKSQASLSLPEKTCALTFDDGHRSSLDFAQELLAVGAKGTFFLTADYCRKRPDFLRADEVRALAGEGFDFGTHGVTHRPLNSLPPEELRREISESKAWLEDLLGRPVSAMSLPAGQGGRAVEEEAFRQGYRLVGTSRVGANRTLQLPGTVNRMVVLSSHGAGEVLQIASASTAYVWRCRLRAMAIWLPKKVLRTSQRVRAQGR